ncbi:MAG: ParB/RepB/Spo0J family partition protein [Bacteroidia bacterium]|nr:ParB/RepB/Spo0J family partition protein [Bacteroidia bacterium]
MSTIKRKALGRGLGSILPTDLPAERPLVSEISLDQIEVNPYQPRHEFDQNALEELAASIREHGIIQPLTVRKLSEGQYQLISGERRMRASKLAGLTEVPAYVRTADDEQMLEMALIENIQREDLNPVEIALSYQRLIEELKLTQEAVADKVGKKRPTITNYLSLLRLPADVMDALRRNQISMGHAKALLSIEDPVLQLRALKEILEKDLSVRMTEALAAQLRQAKAQAKQAVAAAPANPNQIHLNKVADQLEEKFGNKVRVVQGATGKGEIVIPFNSTGDLNRLLEMFDL